MRAVWEVIGQPHLLSILPSKEGVLKSEAFENKKLYSGPGRGYGCEEGAKRGRRRVQGYNLAWHIMRLRDQ